MDKLIYLDDCNICKYIMMRQEMESYPIIIEACLHNNDDRKQNEDAG